MEDWYLTIGAGFFLSLIHLLGPHMEKFVEGRHIQITSLSSGMFLSYIFLDAFKTISESHIAIGKHILFSMFLGFILYHVFNKYLYQHIKEKKVREASLDRLRYAGAVLDSVFAGFALVIIMDINQPIYFALLPFILHTFSATLAFQSLHRHFKTSGFFKSFLAFSPLIGAFTGKLILVEIEAFYSLLAFVVGAVFYIAVRHMLPRGEAGNLWCFVLGSSAGSILFIL